MMRRSFFLALAGAALPSWLVAATVDGAWLISRDTDKGSVEFELKLTVVDGVLTGMYGRKGRRNTIDIRDGMVDGDELSFKTVQKSKKGENSILWKAKVSGDTMTGEFQREGAKRAQKFTAKRQ